MIFYALLALSVVISLFGIVNTLVLSIFERTREIGMLRAVGTTRRQLRAMIRWEAVITSIIGGLTTSEVRSSHDDRPELRETAARYADAVQDGDMARANDAIAGLPQDSVDAIKQAVLNATSDAITVSMLVLAAVALAGAIFAWVVIGRRRTPDHIQMTHAAAV